MHVSLVRCIWSSSSADVHTDLVLPGHCESNVAQYNFGFVSQCRHWWSLVSIVLACGAVLER